MLTYRNLNNFSKDLIKLVYSIALNYKNDSTDFEDLVQEGLIGLYKAQKNFNPTKKVLFKTYAYYWIKKQILDYLNKQKRKDIFSFDEVDLESLRYVENYDSEEQYRDSSKEIDFDYYCLTDLEKNILKFSFYENLSLKEISKRLNLSTERVRQLYQKALRKIKINKNLTKDLSRVNY